MSGHSFRKHVDLITLLVFTPVFLYAQSALININTATLQELDTLPGVGPVTAQSIIDNRPYATVGEISRADGIGEPGSPSYENIINLITVGEPDNSNDNEDSSGTKDSSSIEEISSVPSYSELKPASVPTKLYVGKDRTESVGSPIFFKVDGNFTNISNGDFRWNFGDGSVGYGRETVHAYEYSGEYVLVFTLGSMSGESARVNLKIVDPQFSITKATPEMIEIKNNSKAEASLSGRVIYAGGASFVFPHDTFIRSGQSISFSSKVTNLFPLSPTDVSIITVGYIEQPKLIAKIEEEKLKQIESIKNQISTLQMQVASAYRSTAQEIPGELPQELLSEESEEIEKIENYGLETASVKIGWLQMIKRFFLR